MPSSQPLVAMSALHCEQTKPMPCLAYYIESAFSLLNPFHCESRQHGCNNTSTVCDHINVCYCHQVATTRSSLIEVTPASDHSSYCPHASPCRKPDSHQLYTATCGYSVCVEINTRSLRTHSARRIILRDDIVKRQTSRIPAMSLSHRQRAADSDFRLRSVGCLDWLFERVAYPCDIVSHQVAVALVVPFR